ncbi:MAG: hypothetical protein QOD35_2171, partial [Nocardioidaceae bacterium]|nr:hypothetical protein [Nocardioidaceae bacterium]
PRQSRLVKIMSGRRRTVTTNPIAQPSSARGTRLDVVTELHPVLPDGPSARDAAPAPEIAAAGAATTPGRWQDRR